MKLSFAAKHGFTIIELVVVITVMGILASIILISYSSTQPGVVDKATKLDVDRMVAAQQLYAAQTGASGIPYYSGDPSSSPIEYAHQASSVIDVVVSSSGFCVRGYSQKGNKNSISNALTRESSPGLCATLPASTQAIADSP
jgi:prepilin-type N-terminal cleavage/methylation domain-containing protein